VTSDDDSGSNSTSIVIFRAIEGEHYEIAVDGFYADSGAITLRVFSSGYPAPVWTLPTAIGGLVSSASFRNKVVLIDFFETVCTACRDETPLLVYIHTYFRPQGFEVVGISKDLSAATVFYNVRDLGINYTVVLNRPEVETAFNGPSPVMIPTKFLVDREGKIQMKLVGTYSLSFYNELAKAFVRHASNLPLTIRQQTSSQLFLSWPAREFGWTLQSASNLGPLSWAPASAAIYQTNDENTAAISYLGPGSFFRLTHQ
jgi:peroxiredoxin